MVIHSLFPDLATAGVAIGWAPLEDLQGTLDPDEWDDILSAAPSRQREFIAGRRLVKVLADTLELSAQPLRRASDRSPLWPADRRGSLSHCTALCAAAVGRHDAVQSIGIDIEKIGRIEPKLWPTLFSKNERAYFDSLNPERLAAETTVFFSAKEAFYKCQYPLTESWVGFQDVEVTRIDDCRLGIAPPNLPPQPCHGPSIHTARLDDTHVATIMLMPI